MLTVDVKQQFNNNKSTSARHCISEMVDAGGHGSFKKCPGMALADLGDVEGFDRSGEEDQLYAFQLSDGVYKRKKFTLSEGFLFYSILSFNLGRLSGHHR